MPETQLKQSCITLYKCILSLLVSEPVVWYQNLAYRSSEPVKGSKDRNIQIPNVL